MRLWLENESNEGITVTDEDVAHRMMWVMSLLQQRYMQELENMDKSAKVPKTRDLEDLIADIKSGKEPEWKNKTDKK